MVAFKSPPPIEIQNLMKFAGGLQLRKSGNHSALLLKHRSKRSKLFLPGNGPKKRKTLFLNLE